MKLLRTYYHPEAQDLSQKTVFDRLATRAICLKGDDILLLYTERYQDYSLPGGGLDKGEDIIEGLARELREETGAQNILNITPFGIYKEYRPWYKPDFDIVHMTSYCYTCDVDRELSDTKLENYEINNGMKPLWINIHQAISHNQETIKNSDKSGLSIERETYLLKLIVADILS